MPILAYTQTKILQDRVQISNSSKLIKPKSKTWSFSSPQQHLNIPFWYLLTWTVKQNWTRRRLSGENLMGRDEEGGKTKGRVDATRLHWPSDLADETARLIGWRWRPWWFQMKGVEDLGKHLDCYITNIQRVPRESFKRRGLWEQESSG